MARSIAPLVLGKVIGDVVDMFCPVKEFTVHYGSKQVSNGYNMKPSGCVEEPHVQILGPRSISSDLYTLVMVDPDAPSPSEPTLREWLHWMVVNIPQGYDATTGREVVSYMGPRPTIGIHRYVFVMFKQDGEMGEGVLDVRANFKTRHFAAHYGLGLPVAVLYFNSKREPANNNNNKR